ncbi:hypothetical protein QCBJ_18025 [Pseudomonas sp. QC2]|nr:hypothetical protein QCBJ_18025 [Pseudomonas sp. QC2]
MASSSSWAWQRSSCSDRSSHAGSSLGAGFLWRGSLLPLGCAAVVSLAGASRSSASKLAR